MELHIVNPDPRYPKANLIEPTPLGYLYLAGKVRRGSGPVVLPSIQRSRLLKRLKTLARQLERVDAVLKATVFRAIVRPPTARFSPYLQQRGPSFHIADFDVLILIQIESPDAARDVQATLQYRALVEALEREAESSISSAARNVKRIGDVDTTRDERKGLFLFNHFAAADTSVMLELWEYLAGWYAAETGLDNSVALAPVDLPYAIVNWARWDVSPLRHFWHQLSKKSFWRYVTANLEANRAASMPIYCRLA
jgi:hypothetical protein